MFWTSVLYYAGQGADGPSVIPGPIQLSEASLLYGLTIIARLLAILATSSCSCSPPIRSTSWSR